VRQSKYSPRRTAVPQSIRELTIHPGLVEKLTHLEQEKDPARALDIFNEAESLALDVLLHGSPLFDESDRGKWRRAWRALRAKYRRSSSIVKPDGSLV
jgi:hypothetical protein